MMLTEKAASDAVRARRWFELSVTDEEASSVTLIPEDVRRQLYPEVYRYGPEWKQVEAFFKALSYAHVSQRRSGVFIKIGWLWSGDVQNITFDAVQEWGKRNHYFSLASLFYDECVTRFPERGHVAYMAITLIAELISGQRLFDAEMVKKLQSCVGPVNEILVRLEVEPLGGVFSSSLLER